MVWTGRAVALVALIVAIMFTWKDVLGISSAGGFHLYPKIYGIYQSGRICHVYSRHVLEKNDWCCSRCGRDHRAGPLLFSLMNMAPAVFGNNTWLWTAYPNGKGGL